MQLSHTMATIYKKISSIAFPNSAIFLNGKMWLLTHTGWMYVLEDSFYSTETGVHMVMKIGINIQMKSEFITLKVNGLAVVTIPRAQNNTKTRNCLSLVYNNLIFSNIAN